MKIKDYFIEMVKRKVVVEYNWLVAVLNRLPKDTDNPYLKKENGVLYAKIDTNLVKIHDYVDGKPVLDTKNIITLKKGELSIVQEDIRTPIRRALYNTMLLEIGLNGKVSYINEMYSPMKVINGYIVPKLKSNIKGKSFEDYSKDRDNIYVDEYLVFVNVLTVLASLSKFVTIASTERSLTPATGIDKYKNERIKYYKSKYGENAFKDFSVVAMLEEDISNYDKEYLKGDPTLGITTGNKIIKISRKKRFGMLGAEEGFVRTPDANTILEPLNQGLPTDPKVITAQNNVARVGSYLRGFETRIAGESANKMAAATVGYTIKQKSDCGTKDYVSFLVKEENKKSLIGLYLVNEQGKPEMLTENTLNSFVNKYIKLRLPETCKLQGDNICEKCIGENMAAREGGILSAAIELGGKGLDAKMKRMHGVILTSMKLNPLDIVY